MDAYLTYDQVRSICATINEKYLPNADSFIDTIDNILDELEDDEIEVNMLILAIFQALLGNVDKEIAKIEANMNIAASCQKGCAHCCYHPIIITKLEAKIITLYIHSLAEARRNKIIDHLDYYFEQHQLLLEKASAIDFHENDNFKYEYISKRLPCPFLDTKTNSCIVHEIRPNPCRTYLSYSDPRLCSTSYLPKEPFSYHFLETYVIAALSEFVEELYEEGLELPFELPEDLLVYNYLPLLLRNKY